MENLHRSAAGTGLQEMLHRQSVLLHKAVQSRVRLGGWIRNPENQKTSFLIYAEYLILIMLANVCTQKIYGHIRLTSVLGAGVMAFIEIVIMTAVLILAYKVAYNDSMPVYVGLNTIALSALVYGVLNLLNALLRLSGFHSLFLVLQLLIGCLRVLVLFRCVQAAGQSSPAGSIAITLTIFLATAGIDAVITLTAMAGSLETMISSFVRSL